MSRFSKLTDWYFSKDATPYWIIVIMDIAIFYAAWIAIYAFFVGYQELLVNFWPLMHTVTIFAIPQLIFYKIFHTYMSVVRYSSFVDLLQIIYAVSCASAVDVILHYFTNNSSDYFTDTRVVQIVLVAVAAVFVMIFIRIVVKFMYDNFYQSADAKNTFIYGVKDGGIGLAKNIRNDKPARFILKGFITHDESLNYTHLLGEKVYSVNDKLPEVLVKNKIEVVLVSPLRNDEFRENTQLQDYIISAGCKIYMMQLAGEWDPSKVQKTELRPVKIEDLLPREQIQVDMDSIGKLIQGKKIIVTGSGGSIGSEIVRQVAKYSPAEMLLLDQAETPQHDVSVEMARNYPNIKVNVIVTSICHSTRMDIMFDKFRPDYVFHAAAYKHVPMMEGNPQEAVLNNVYSTKVMADLSVKYGVKKFVMISTDEIYVQSLNKAEQDGKVKGNTQFVTTRFGNVLGSNGSVIPLFEQQIKAGGPVTVTDPNIVRFFMLIPEACKLVLEAGTKGNGGEIFVFDMGKAVKISDLAKKMIKLSGAEGIEIKYTGLREGEKLYEEMLASTENTLPSFHEKIRIAKVREYDYSIVREQIDNLIAVAKTYQPMATVKVMKEIVPEYISNNSVYTLLDK